MRALVLLALLLLAPAASAACTELGCVHAYDEDADGVPDGVIGGVGSPVELVPGAGFGANRTDRFVYAEVVALHLEEGPDPPVEPPAALLTAYASESRARDGSRSAYAEVVVETEDHETGDTSEIAAAWVHLADADKDGVPDTVRTSPSFE